MNLGKDFSVEYGRKIENKKYVDAIAVHLSMPEFDYYETVKQRMQYFFSNIQVFRTREIGIDRAESEGCFLSEGQRMR